METYICKNNKSRVFLKKDIISYLIGSSYYSIKRKNCRKNNDFLVCCIFLCQEVEHLIFTVSTIADNSLLRSSKTQTWPNTARGVLEPQLDSPQFYQMVAPPGTLPTQQSVGSPLTSQQSIVPTSVSTLNTMFDQNATLWQNGDDTLYKSWMTAGDR